MNKLVSALCSFGLVALVVIAQVWIFAYQGYWKGRNYKEDALRKRDKRIHKASKYKK